MSVDMYQELSEMLKVETEAKNKVEEAKEWAARLQTVSRHEAAKLLDSAQADARREAEILREKALAAARAEGEAIAKKAEDDKTRLEAAAKARLAEALRTVTEKLFT